MTLLAKWTVAWGFLSLIMAAVCLFLPAKVRQWITAFPRSKAPAWALTFINIVWVVAMVSDIQFGPKYDPYKPLIYIIAPAVYFMICILMNELLAPRSLGFLLLLLQSPILEAARLHGSEWGHVMTVFSYVIIVIGITLVLNPYMLRRMMEYWISSDRSCKSWGLIGLLLAAVMLFFAFGIY